MKRIAVARLALGDRKLKPIGGGNDPMKHVKRSTAVTRGQGIDLCTSTAALFLSLAILLAASASQAQVTVAVGNGLGAPGGTASVRLILSAAIGLRIAWQQ